jgi:hypothetical protein
MRAHIHEERIMSKNTQEYVSVKLELERGSIDYDDLRQTLRENVESPEVKAACRRLLQEHQELEEDDDRSEVEDSPSLENCDDWGTGEGRWHGRM